MFESGQRGIEEKEKERNMVPKFTTKRRHDKSFMKFQRSIYQYGVNMSHCTHVCRWLHLGNK